MIIMVVHLLKEKHRKILKYELLNLINTIM